MIHKKGDITATEIVVAIATLVVFFILFGGYKAIKEVMYSDSEDKICTMSAIASAHTKTFGKESMKIKCPIHFESISLKDLEKEESRSKRTMNSMKNWNPPITFEYDALEFTLNRKVAEEMRQCWSKMGEGRLNLFSEWWAPLTTEKPDDKWWEVWDYEIKGPPMSCVICSRMKFDEEIRSDDKKGLKKVYITSLYDWTLNNPLPNNNVMSYNEYLLDDVSTGLFNLGDSGSGHKRYNYYINKPLAVVFARQQVLKTKLTAEQIAAFVSLIDDDDVSVPVDMIYLIPYEEVGQRCTVLAN